MRWFPREKIQLCLTDNSGRNLLLLKSIFLSSCSDRVSCIIFWIPVLATHFTVSLLIYGPISFNPSLPLWSGLLLLSHLIPLFHQLHWPLTPFASNPPLPLPGHLPLPTHQTHPILDKIPKLTSTMLPTSKLKTSIKRITKMHTNLMWMTRDLINITHLTLHSLLPFVHCSDLLLQV